MSTETVPKGYKRTEVGVIPEEWEVRRLSDVADILTGIAKNSNSTVNNAIHVHYLRVANVQDGYLDLTEVSQLLVNREDIRRYSVLPGDVLMNEGGDLDKLGRGAIWRGEFDPCIHQNHVFVVRCHKGMTAEYLNSWTSGSAARRYFLLAGRQTTNLASINKTSLGELPIPSPPVAEQEAIAAALSDADALIEALESLLDKKRQIKQGAVQELLTGKRRLPGFTGKWVTNRLDEIASIRSGGTPSTTRDEYWNGGIPWCTPTDITKLGDAKYISDTETRISELGLISSSAELIPANSVVMTSRATIGACAINLVPLATNQGFKSLIPSDTVNHEFLYYLLTTKKQAFIRLCAGSTFLEIGKSQLTGFEVQMPSLPEQTAIAAVLSDMDTELEALEAKLDKARQVKQGMMQQLLTGKVRLV